MFIPLSCWSYTLDFRSAGFIYHWAGQYYKTSAFMAILPKFLALNFGLAKICKTRTCNFCLSPDGQIQLIFILATFVYDSLLLSLKGNIAAGQFSKQCEHQKIWIYRALFESGTDVGIFWVGLWGIAVNVSSQWQQSEMVDFPE